MLLCAFCFLRNSKIYKLLLNTAWSASFVIVNCAICKWLFNNGRGPALSLWGSKACTVQKRFLLWAQSNIADWDVENVPRITLREKLQQKPWKWVILPGCIHSGGYSGCWCVYSNVILRMPSIPLLVPVVSHALSWNLGLGNCSQVLWTVSIIQWWEPEFPLQWVQVKLSGRETSSVQKAARANCTQLLLTQFSIFSLLDILFTITVFSLITRINNSYADCSVNTSTIILLLNDIFSSYLLL